MEMIKTPKQSKRKAKPGTLNEDFWAGGSTYKRSGNIAPEVAKYAISCDWVEFMLESASSLVAYNVPLDRYDYSLGKIHLEKLKLGTKIFEFGYDVFLHGRKMGVMYCSPRMKEGVLKPTNMSFKVQNNLLYEVGWLDDIKFLFAEMKWECRNLTRVDIALDGKGFFGAWAKYRSGKIQRVGHMVNVQPYEKHGGGKIILTGFDVGSRSSDKWLTCYGKSDELKSGNNNKQYIFDYWVRSGLDTKRVERMELKLRNESIKLLDCFYENGNCVGWKRLDDFEFLASIFRTFVDGGNLVNVKTGEVKQNKGLLCFVVSSLQKNVCRKQKVEFINWKNIGAVKLDKLTAKETTEVYGMKFTAKRLVLLSESCKQFKSKLDHPIDRRIEEEKYLQRAIQFRNEAHEIASNINCLGWLSDHVESWIEQYKKRKLRYIPNFRIENANGEMQYCYEFEADLHLKK